jgi:hypothetical protein
LRTALERHESGGVNAVEDYFSTGGRYAFDPENGWIDLQHVASSAGIRRRFGFSGEAIGFLVEIEQFVFGYFGTFDGVLSRRGLRNSAFKYEDMLSNELGEEYGKSGQLPSTVNLVGKSKAMDLLRVK